MITSKVIECLIESGFAIMYTFIGNLKFQKSNSHDIFVICFETIKKHEKTKYCKI